MANLSDVENVRPDLPDVEAWSDAEPVLSNTVTGTGPGEPLGAWEARVHVRRGHGRESLV